MRVFYRILRLCILVLAPTLSSLCASAQSTGERYTFDTAFCISESFPINLNTVTEKQLPPQAGEWVDAKDGSEVSFVFDPQGKAAGRYEYHFLPSKTVCGLYPGDTVAVIIDLFPDSGLKDFVLSICEESNVDLWLAIHALPIDTSYIEFYDNDGKLLTVNEASSANVGRDDVTQFYYKVNHPNACNQDSGFVYFNLDEVPFDLANTNSEEVRFCANNTPHMINLNDVIGGIAEEWQLKDFASQPSDLQNLINRLLDVRTGEFHIKEASLSGYTEFNFQAISSSSCGAGVSNVVKIIIDPADNINFANLGGDTLKLCSSDMSQVYSLNRYLNVVLPDNSIKWTTEDLAAKSFLDTTGILDARNLVPGFYTFTATYVDNTEECGLRTGQSTNIYMLIQDELEFGTTNLLASMCYNSTENLNDMMPTQLGMNISFELQNPNDNSSIILSESEIEAFSPANYPSVITDATDTTYQILYSFTDAVCKNTDYKDTLYLTVLTGNENVELSDKDLYACYSSAGLIKLQHILGYYGKGTWASAEPLDYFDATNGEFYGKTQFIADNVITEKAYSFTFTPDAASSCLTVNSPVNVIVTLTNDLEGSAPDENYVVTDTIQNEDRRPINLMDYIELSSLEGYWTLDDLSTPTSMVLNLEDFERYPEGEYNFVYTVPGNGEHCVNDTIYFRVNLVLYGLPLNVQDSLMAITCSSEDNGGIYVNIIEGSKPYNVVLTQFVDGTTSTIFNGTFAAETDTTFTPLEGMYELCIVDFANDTFRNTYNIVRPEPIMVNKIQVHNVTSGQRNNGVLEVRISGGTDPYYAIVIGSCDPVLNTCNDFITDSVIWSEKDDSHKYFLSYDSLPAGDYRIFVMDSSRYYYYDNDDLVTANLTNLDAGVCSIDTFFTIGNDPLMLNCPDTLSVYGSENCEFTIPNIKALVGLSGGAEDYDLTVVVQDPETGEYITGAILPSDVEKYYEVNVYARAPIAGGATDANGQVILDTLAQCQVVLDVTCRKDLIVGQIITPNNDGKNDTWLIQGLENYPNHKIRVYGRWGDLVFETSYYRNDWAADCRTANCMGNGNLPVGTYYWIIDLGIEGDNEVLSGFMEVVY
ncbi:MAG: gliding motility-associated C-terminal domain-containing protein [Bacteroidales bacterium]